jgi:hypothetical protein
MNGRWFGCSAGVGFEGVTRQCVMRGSPFFVDIEGVDLGFGVWVDDWD